MKIFNRYLRKPRATVAALAFICLFAGASAPDALAQEKVIVGVVGGAGNAGFIIAKDSGYFAAEGLDVSFVRFNAASKMMPSLGTGDLDVAVGAPSASLYNAAARRIELKIVAGFVRSIPNSYYESLIIRKDWIESGRFKGYADLKGARVAINAPGTSLGPAFNAAAIKGGLSFDDLKVSHISFPDQITAMRNQAIDATITVEPFVGALVRGGIGKIFAKVDDFYPSFQVGLVFFGNKFMSRRPVAEKFLRAYVRGVRDYKSIIKDDRFIGGPKAEKIIDMISAYLGVAPDRIRNMYPPPIDAHVNVESLRKDLAFFKSRGDVTDAKITVDQLTDFSFLTNAEASLKQ